MKIRKKQAITLKIYVYQQSPHTVRLTYSYHRLSIIIVLTRNIPTIYIYIYVPRSNNPALKRPVPGNSGDFVQAVFRTETCGSFSSVFLQDTVTFLHLPCRFLWDPVVGIFDLGAHSLSNSVLISLFVDIFS